MTLHVSIIHRHALTDIDGTQEETENKMVTEEFFVLSDDRGHDAHFVRAVRALIDQYLTDIGYKVELLHEFTDGCSAQYKSRHTIGDLSYSQDDLGYNTCRNIFETSMPRDLKTLLAG